MLDQKTKETLKKTVGGVDVYDHALARELRLIKAEHPDYIEIVNAMAYHGDGTDKMPYFGAILTIEGFKAISGFNT